MSNTLQVVRPYFSLLAGDTLELTKDGNGYEAVRREEFNKVGKNGEDFSSSYTCSYLISTEMAEELVKEGFFKEVDNKTQFVNVFDEIDTLLERYTKELDSIDSDMKNCQECVKLEKFTVLNNLITLLNHLKGLKK